MIKRFLSILLAICVLCSLTVFAREENVELYFSPQPMRDDGKLDILISIRNLAKVLPEGTDGISAMQFDIRLDMSAVGLIKSESDRTFDIMDGAVITNVTDILENDVDQSMFRFMFVDHLLGERLITRDGVIAKITLQAKNKRTFYNTDDTYNIEFVKGSIGASAYQKTVDKIIDLKSIVGWNYKFGGYTPQQWLPPLSGKAYKEIVFTVDSNNMEFDGEYHEIDARAYIDESTGKTMLPVRYVCEGAGYGVNWDEYYQRVDCAWATKTLTIFVKESKVMLKADGGEKTSLAVSEVDDRMYVDAEILAEFIGYDHYVENGKVIMIERD